jgi:FlaA1/EpsC-like NDP-sugar epimerase
MSAIVGKLGFPIEIGGFLAGLALANSAQNFEIAGRVRPLRDFFILIFFVILGSSIAFSSFSGLAVPILVFSFFVLVGNPLIVLVVMGFMGYRKRTSFLTGMTVAQISEFSLVLVALGLKIGHISPEIVTLVTGVGVVTITISTYLIIYGDKIYRRIHHLISIFEKKNAKDDDVIVQTYKKPIILIGAHRTGRSIADQLSKKDLLIIDFDPDVVKEFVEHKYDVIFGDIADPEIFEKAGIAEAKLVISTSPDFEDNMNLLQEVMNLKANRPKVILRSDDEKQAEMLYKEGADYVLLPNFTSGQYLGKTVAYDADMKILSQLRKKDLEMIAERVYR